MYYGKMVICSFSVTIETKATEQYFPVALFILLFNMALTFECVNEIPKWDHLNESYWAALSYGIVYYYILYKMVLT